jgi:hypothetical protein
MTIDGINKDNSGTDLPKASEDCEIVGPKLIFPPPIILAVAFDRPTVEVSIVSPSYRDNTALSSNRKASSIG